jgi:hypothetical protein
VGAGDSESCFTQQVLAMNLGKHRLMKSIIVSIFQYSICNLISSLGTDGLQATRSVPPRSGGDLGWAQWLVSGRGEIPLPDPKVLTLMRYMHLLLKFISNTVVCMVSTREQYELPGDVAST